MRHREQSRIPLRQPCPLAESNLPAADVADRAIADLPSLHHAEVATARRYAEASKAASTQRAYAGGWRLFLA